jgi:hypothetical protein
MKVLLTTVGKIGELTVVADDGEFCDCVCSCGRPVRRSRGALQSAIQRGGKPSCKECMRIRTRRVGAPVKYYRGTTRMCYEPNGEFAAVSTKLR